MFVNKDELLASMGEYPKLAKHYDLVTEVISGLDTDDDGDIETNEVNAGEIVDFVEAAEVVDNSFYSEGPVLEFIELGHDVSYFEEAYCGEWDSKEEYARDYIDSCYDLDKMLGSLANYFDYERFARDLFMDGYTYSNGYVFNDNY